MQRPVGLLAGLVLALFCACGGCLGAWFHGARHGWGRDGVWDAVTATTDAEDE